MSGTEKNRRIVDIFGKKKNFPFLQRRKILIDWKTTKMSSPWQRLIMIASKCVFAACNSFHHWHVPRFVMERRGCFQNRILLREIPTLLAQRWTERGVAIWPTGFEESLIYQLYATAKEMQLLKQTEQMKELRIPSIVLATEENVLLMIGEAKYKLVSGRQRITFWMQNCKTCYRSKIIR